MPTKQYNNQLSILDGGWGAQMGPDLMFQQLEEGYDEDPDAVALICTHQSWGYLRGLVGDERVAGCLTWTYRQLMRAARDLARSLQALGIKRGDRLATFLPTSAEWALAFWIAAVLDLVFVPLDPTSLDKDGLGEHCYPLERLRPSVVLVSTLDDARYFDQLYSDMKDTIKLKIICHEKAGLCDTSWVSFEAPNTAGARITEADDIPHRPGPKDQHIAENRTAVVLFSQSSPGEPPKGCPLSVLNIRTALVNQYTTPGKKYLVTCPSSSSATLEAVMMAWKRGGTVVFSGASSPHMTLSAIELFDCTRLVCTPSHLKELIRHPSRPQRNFTSLESLYVHGGVVDGKLLAQGQRALQTRWASSSLTMAEGFGILGWHSVFPSDRTLDSVGKVMHGSLVKICRINDENKHVVKRGDEGLLHVGGDAIIGGYLDGTSSERFYQDPDGTKWFITEYLATMDGNGLIRMTAEFETRHS